MVWKRPSASRRAAVIPLILGRSSGRNVTVMRCSCSGVGGVAVPENSTRPLTRGPEARLRLSPARSRFPTEMRVAAVSVGSLGGVGDAPELMVVTVVPPPPKNDVVVVCRSGLGMTSTRTS